MAHSKQSATPSRPPVWAAPLKFVFLLSITLGLFLLVHSMVENHFFEGTNYPNRSQVTEPSEP